ncbi:hypothetical protein GVI59_17250 [Acetobacter sicerae]|nr:hypothetical protein [Acetobacter sicerae]
MLSADVAKIPECAVAAIKEGAPETRFSPEFAEIDDISVSEALNIEEFRLIDEEILL